MSEETAGAEVGSEQPGVETFTTKADKTEGAREITVSWNLGKDVNEAIEIFGAEVVKNMFDKAIVVAVQANIRRMLGATNEDGSTKYSDKAIINYVHNEYKPGVRTAREGGTASMDKLIAKLMKLPLEERKKLLGIE